MAWRPTHQLTDAGLIAEAEAIARAEDHAALETPVTLARHLDPTYRRRRHSNLIGRAMSQLRPDGGDRLMILCPPQVGKSLTTVVWGAFWWLANHPTHRVIVGSHTNALALTRGRQVRKLVIQHGHRYGLLLEPGSQQVADWSLTLGGGMKSVGIGAAIAGHPGDCVVGETRIITSIGAIPVADLVRLPAPPRVLSWNHGRRRAEWRRLVASRAIPGRPVVEVRTAAGRTVRCTADHRIWTADAGYVPAAELRPGQRLLAADPGGDSVRPVRPSLSTAPVDRSADQGRDATALLARVPEQVSPGNADLRALRRGLHPAAVRGDQTSTARIQANVLHQGMQPGGGVGEVCRPAAPAAYVCSVRRHSREHGHHLPSLLPPHSDNPGQDPVRPVPRRVPTYPRRAREAVEPRPGQAVLLAGVCGQGAQEPRTSLPELRQAHRVQGPQAALLRPGMPAGGSAPRSATEDVPGVRQRVLAAQLPAPVLRAGVRQHCPLPADGRPRQLALQDGHQPRRMVPADEAADPGAGRTSVPGVRPTRCAGVDRPADWRPMALDPGGAPHQRAAVGQPPREPRHAVPAVPHAAPQVGYDTVSVVRELRGQRVTVYDLQVEGNRNFFADTVLVHNCAIIDDPHKSRAEADSFTRRETVAEWYSGDIIARMAPGAPVIVLMTPWHPDDLRGRLLEQEGRTDGGGRWQVLAMPAFCTHPDRDPLGRNVGDPLPHPKVDAGDVARLRRHWEDKRSGTTIRDWASQYQLDPQPAAGALLTAAQLREQRWLGGDKTVTATPVRAAVAVDPAGGGRDTCGIVGGWLGDDDRLHISHDWTETLGAEVWGERVCLLAVQIDAELVVCEANYGGDMAKMIVQTAWQKLAREELERLGGDRTAEAYRRQARFNRPAPRIVMVHARKGKRLRAEPVAQYWTADRIRTVTYLPDLESEWCTWQPGSADSPGRIDASVHLAWALVPAVPARADATGAAQLASVDLTSQIRPGEM